MMVIICGLPRKTKYEDVKVLLKNECRITEFILDDLVIDESGKGKKVRVGLVEDCDGYEIIRCLNGLRMAGGDSVLRVEAVGKPSTTNQPHQGNYEPKPPPSYLNEYRNSYPNQQSNDLRGRPHAPGFEAPYTGQQSQFSGPAPHGPSADHGTIPTHAPVDSVGRPAPWASNNVPNNQWNQNQSMNLQSSYQQPGNPGYAQQYSSNSQRPFPQARPQVDQGFRYSDNTNKRENAVINLTKGHRKTDARPHVLRNVELVDTQPTNPPLQSFRYPPPSQGFQQQKPITIMKDNFQGPTAYDISANNPPNSYQRQNQSSPQPWAQHIKPRLYTKGNEDPYEKSYEDMRQHGVDSKRADSGKSIQQPMKSDVYKDFEKPGPRFSPNRVIAPGGRQFSPSRRLISPSGGRHSPPIRGLSPSNPLPQGRGFSPPGRNRSPTRRLMSPADRMMSTMDRRPGGPPHDLPQRRQLSPTERIGRGNVPRYSPKRHHPDKPIDKNIELDPLKSSKLLRPTYGVQAPNQPMYSGGFRPNVHENAPFPRSSRQLEQDVPWQQDEDQMYGKMKKRDEDGNSTSRQNAYGDARSPRKSRSPVRRDRSPIKDRYRRHSPSSSSPRRSWALEKYRSPEAREAPPPPNWPGQDSRVDGRFKTGSDRKEDNPKHVSSWERHAFSKDDESNRRDEKLKPYAAGPSKVFRDDFGNKIDTSRGDPFNKQQRDPKFLGRNEFENRGGYRQNARDEPKTNAEYHHVVERESIRRQGEFRRKESPRREEGKGNNFTGLDKEFEGIYKRAQEFKKKAEEMSKPERRLTEYSEERGRASRIIEDKERQDERGSLTGRVGDASRHYRDDSSKRRTGDSPRRRMEDSPRHRMEDSPRRRMENSPRRHMETSPRRRMETSSGLRIETSPRRRMEASPRRRMEPSPQRRMEASPLHRMEASPRRRMEDPPRRRTDDSPSQSRTDTGDRHPEWKTVDMVRKTYAGLPTYVKTKREKAAEDIAGKIINKKSFVLELSTEARYRVLEELKTTISYKLTELFDAQDVSYIELVIKFQSKYSDKEKDKMFDDVIKSLPGRFKNWKTFGSDSSNVPHKRLKVSTDRTEETRGVLNRTSKRSPDRYITEKSSEVPLKKSKLSPEYKIKDATQSGVYIPDWKLNIEPPKHEVPTLPLITPSLPVAGIAAGHIVVPQLLPMQLPPSQLPTLQLPPPQLVIPTLSSSSAQWMAVTPQFDKNVPQQTDIKSILQPAEALYELFLCQDDFGLITAVQAELLKNFVISQIIKVTETSQGWAPDFTFKGLQSMRRYMMCTNNTLAKNWLMNLDFSGFALFNVLVYTKEQLWYERAAIWLPGHSKNQKREPLDKLRLQNKKLEGVNIGKWKLVKKIVTVNGTRLYVDMPPASARALEKHNMLLSYELQKVEVLLKAVAVNKDAFDVGLKEKSITDESILKNIFENTLLPSIQNNPSVLKLALRGRKDMTHTQARNIKEIIILHIYKYHSDNGVSRTDFIEYGFISPHYFGVIPENAESKRWLMNEKLGRVNHYNVIVIADDDDTAKYFSMSIIVPNEPNINALAIVDKLKQSNNGVKGVNFQLWKPIKLKLCRDKTKVEIFLEMDLQSVETLIDMDYKLNYLMSPENNITVHVDSELARHKLLEAIKLANK